MQWRATLLAINPEADFMFDPSFQGGESTREEMCFSFIYYYPEVPVTYCVSSPSTDQYMDWFHKYAP